MMERRRVALGSVLLAIMTVFLVGVFFFNEESGAKISSARASIKVLPIKVQSSVPRLRSLKTVFADKVFVGIIAVVSICIIAAISFSLYYFIFSSYAHLDDNHFEPTTPQNAVTEVQLATTPSDGGPSLKQILSTGFMLIMLSVSVYGLYRNVKTNCSAAPGQVDTEKPTNQNPPTQAIVKKKTGVHTLSDIRAETAKNNTEKDQKKPDEKDTIKESRSGSTAVGLLTASKDKPEEMVVEKRSLCQGNVFTLKDLAKATNPTPVEKPKETKQFIFEGHLTAAPLRKPKRKDDKNFYTLADL